MEDVMDTDAWLAESAEVLLDSSVSADAMRCRAADPDDSVELEQLISAVAAALRCMAVSARVPERYITS